MPGTGDVIDGAMQQAPQPARQETAGGMECTSAVEKWGGVKTGTGQPGSILPSGHPFLTAFISESILLTQ